MCECGSEQVVLKGGFGAWEDGRWFGWVLRGLRWPSRGFSKHNLQNKAYRKNYKGTHGNYRRKTGKLQEEAESNFRYFEGVRVGGKGG